MSLLANIIGFSFVGLAARFGHLGIQKRNLFSNPGGHVLAMGAFGFVGYWAHYWEIHSSEMIKRKLEKIKEGRQANATAETNSE
ncbi:hypothetical protein M413DRAFT_28333 [Hebeloma cylindrosporum]|uniref:Uncharacterized protein n=1 Tax=Hebeloma cylindrosporum TaxID=76867 RepID=A0A0C3BV35_HEBCY|nr:hypothetical protein M413DRAFT_28333 [Hebeloma cylindrosporum h7]